MAHTIFFSWQADTPTRVGRNFIKDVLEEVCAEIAAETSVDEAPRPLAVDSDTQGVAGQPPIVETIFKKIDAAEIFVGDVTFVGKRIDKRPTPNPNVLIEYGWALKSKTHERVILLMNRAYGTPSGESLPFNMRHVRWPITYLLSESATAEERQKQKSELVKVLSKAIRTSLDTIPLVTDPFPAVFPEMQPKDGPARFRNPEEALGFEDESFEDLHRDIFLNAGPAMWLRLMPSTNPKKMWTVRELKSAGKDSRLLLPMLHGAGYSPLRASDGTGMFQADGERSVGQGRRNTGSVAFAFKTGEVWSIDTYLLAHNSQWIYQPNIEKCFCEAIERYSQFLMNLGSEPPYRWKAGATGLRGRMLGYPPPPGKSWLFSNRGPVCAADIIEAEGTLEFEQSARSALVPFFQKIFEDCDRERPEYMPQS